MGPSWSDGLEDENHRVLSVFILLNELSCQLKFQRDNVRGKNIFIECAVYRVFQEEY